MGVGGWALRWEGGGGGGGGGGDGGAIRIWTAQGFETGDPAAVAALVPLLPPPSLPPRHQGRGQPERAARIWQLGPECRGQAVRRADQRRQHARPDVRERVGPGREKQMGVAARGAHDADEPSAQITDVAPVPQHRSGERERRRFEITIRDPPQGTVRYDRRRVVEARERREPREPVWNVAMPQEREAVGAGKCELQAL